jgi:hypothetical protein
MAQRCLEYPEDRQLAFRFERCCIVLLVEHLLESIRVTTDGIRKVFLRLESRDSAGLIDLGDFERISEFSWPFDCTEYHTAVGERRSAILADVAEAALVAIARHRGWSVTPIHEIFAKIRDANYTLEADRAKACRSPDGTKRAKVSYFADRTEFRVVATISGPKRAILLNETIYRGPPTHGLCVHSVLGKPFWESENQLIVPFRDASVPNGQIHIILP